MSSNRKSKEDKHMTFLRRLAQVIEDLRTIGVISKEDEVSIPYIPSEKPKDIVVSIKFRIEEHDRWGLSKERMNLNKELTKKFISEEFFDCRYTVLECLCEENEIKFYFFETEPVTNKNT